VRMGITAMSRQELLEPVINDRREKVDALAADIRQQGIDVTSQVMTGTPFLEIIRQVLRDKHDLVFLVAEGKSRLKERLFGSISMHLIQVWFLFAEDHLEARAQLGSSGKVASRTCAKTPSGTTEAS